MLITCERASSALSLLCASILCAGCPGSSTDTSDAAGDAQASADREDSAAVDANARDGAPSGDASVEGGDANVEGGDASAESGDGRADEGPTGDAARLDGSYTGPSVGLAAEFAALAYNSITTANISTIDGELGVSSAAVSTITGFDAPTYVKYGSDSLAPHAGLTGRAQMAVTALVGNIDPRPCDADYTSVPGGLTGDITLHPGVTCMNSYSNDVLLNGHVFLDAGGDPNAFFIIRGNKTLTAANGAQVVLLNGAQSCSVFWRISEAVTMGTTVRFYGTVIAGTAITMRTGSTLEGRALAQTAGVQLDANTITVPSRCTHIQ